MWLTKGTESGGENNVPAPRLKGLWKTIVEGWMFRHGLGRTSGRLMAEEGHGGTMRGMDVYQGGGEARLRERTALGVE